MGNIEPGGLRQFMSDFTRPIVTRELPADHFSLHSGDLAGPEALTFLDDSDETQKIVSMVAARVIAISIRQGVKQDRTWDERRIHTIAAAEIKDELELAKQIFDAAESEAK